MDWTADQGRALDRIQEWFREVGKPGAGWCNADHSSGGVDEGEWHTHPVTVPAPAMSLGGYAGSGKTTLVKALKKLLGVQIAYATPTHKAAGVLRKKIAEVSDEEASKVRTIHSMIYKTTPFDRCKLSGVLLTEKPRTCSCPLEECEHPRIYVTPCKDGVSHECAVDRELKFERRQYLHGQVDLVVLDESSMLSTDMVTDMCAFGIPILLVGDHGQLSPVKAQMNPWMKSPEIRLESIVRQGAGSGILTAAMEVRQTGRPLDYGWYGKECKVVRKNDPSVKELLDRMTPGSNGQALLVPTNKLRAMFNTAFHGDGPVRVGEKIIALQRIDAHVLGEDGIMNGQVTVNNGSVGVVEGVKKVFAKRIHMVVRMENGTRVLADAAREQFGAEGNLMRNQTPPGTQLWDYAYALTVHKAQGSEWPHVVVFGEPWTDYGRWTYTALTRASEGVVMVRN